MTFAILILKDLSILVFYSDSMWLVIFERSIIFVSAWHSNNPVALLLIMMVLSFIYVTIRESVTSVGMLFILVKESLILVIAWPTIQAETVTLIILPFSIVHSTVYSNPSTSSIYDTRLEITFIKVLVGNKFDAATIGSAFFIYFSLISTAIIIS